MSLTLRISNLPQELIVLIAAFSAEVAYIIRKDKELLWLEETDFLAGMVLDKLPLVASLPKKMVAFYYEKLFGELEQTYKQITKDGIVSKMRKQLTNGLECFHYDDDRAYQKQRDTTERLESFHFNLDEAHRTCQYWKHRTAETAHRRHMYFVKNYAKYAGVLINLEKKMNK